MSDKDAKKSGPGETHGSQVAIDDHTLKSDVKAPNVLQRAKEEIEAIVETINPHKETKNNVSLLMESERTLEKRIEDTNAQPRLEKPDSASQEKDANTRNLIESPKGGNKANMQKAKSPHHHHKETHGRSGVIDEDTPITDIKGPNVFERAKEELEALVDVFHPKDEADKTDQLPKEEEGCFGISLGKGLEKVCSPFGQKKD